MPFPVTLLNEPFQQKSPNTICAGDELFPCYPFALKAIKVITLALGDKSFQESILQLQRSEIPLCQRCQRIC